MDPHPRRPQLGSEGPCHRHSATGTAAELASPGRAAARHAAPRRGDDIDLPTAT